MSPKGISKKRKHNINLVYLGIVLVVSVVTGTVIWSLANTQSELSAWVFRNRLKNKTSNPQNLPSGIGSVKTEKTEGSPRAFSDIPLNGRQEAVSSYAMNYENSGFGQQGVEFISEMSVEKNFEFYKEWAKNNYWDILYQLRNSDQSILNIRNKDRVLVISITKHQSDATFSKINISE